MRYVDRSGPSAAGGPLTTGIQTIAGKVRVALAVPPPRSADFVGFNDQLVNLIPGNCKELWFLLLKLIPQRDGQRG